ncbi:hypothetical protein BJ508DRAFT_412238 [Ascobolus immersus RN42]|uniref:Uncharacterized protein n=1 Tax=Ascobolus immersus RN42 TaxID=1160509 RepID=A0A3N4IGZ5_ASCIM|nr:hypothetical protein BJ508DRAFT_412238 [Ascobolus immersus RN42]
MPETLSAKDTALRTTDILLLLFRSLSSFATYASLSQTCRRIHDVAKANKSGILRDMASKLFLPEALQLLEQQRSSVMSDLELARFRLNCTNPEAADWLQQHRLFARKRRFSENEIQLLLKDEEAVDELVAQTCAKIEKVWRVEHKHAKVPQAVGELDKIEIKKAIYNLHILMCQFRLSGVNGFADFRDATMQQAGQLMLKKPWKVDWVYDYSFAASLTTKQLFDILGLGRYLHESDWPGIDMLWSYESTAKRDRRKHIGDGYKDASMKRFAFVNLFKCSELNSFLRKSTQNECTELTWLLPAGYSRAWYHGRDSHEREDVLEKLDAWRSSSEYGFSEGYNSRVFEKRQHPIRVNGKYVLKEILAVRPYGWETLNDTERDLIDEHVDEDWMGYESEPSDYDSDEPNKLFELFMKLDAGGGDGFRRVLSGDHEYTRQQMQSVGLHTYPEPRPPQWSI